MRQAQEDVSIARGQLRAAQLVALSDAAAVDGWWWAEPPGHPNRKKHGPLTRDELTKLYMISQSFTQPLNKALDAVMDEDTLVWAPSMTQWKPYADVFMDQPSLLARVTSRAREELRGFCERLIPTLRSEHTVVNMLAPPDDDEALTQPQARDECDRIAGRV